MGQADTKGPWHFTGFVEDELGFPCVTDKDDLVICSVVDDGISEDEMRANARLIAAAPDLVKALENVRKIISEAAMTGFNCQDGDWADRLFHSQQQSSAALSSARATGGTE